VSEQNVEVVRAAYDAWNRLARPRPRPSPQTDTQGASSATNANQQERDGATRVAYILAAYPWPRRPAPAGADRRGYVHIRTLSANVEGDSPGLAPAVGGRCNSTTS
jgi:hypothetical protein